MGFKQKIAHAVKKVDFFHQPINLRYNQQPDYQTFTGGFVSLALIIVFTIVFTGNLIRTFHRVDITASSTQYNEIEPGSMNVSTSEFMFAMGITGQDMNNGPRWFDIQFNFNSYNNVSRKNTPVKLQKCTRQQWSQIDQSFGNTYDRIHLQQWLCPPPGLVLQLQGKFTSQSFKFYRVIIGKCNQTLDPTRPCVADSQINSYLDKNEVFNFNFYFVNRLLNPGDQQYISNYIEDFNFFPFSPSFGVSANLFLSSYEITTDQSISPLQQTRVDDGWIIRSDAQSLNYQVRTSNYLKLHLRKSSVSYVITRSFQKVDDTLSYIGGLFSTILTLLIILNFYNQVSFELDVAKTMYKYDKEKPLDSENFNFFYFLGFLIYKAFFMVGIQLPWKRMEMYHDSLQEVQKQMDVRLLFRKIQFSQKVTKSVLEPHQIKIVHLQQRLTLKQAEQIRENYDFYDKLQKYYLQFQSNSAKKLEQTNQNKQELTLLEYSPSFNTTKNKINMQNTSSLIQLKNKPKKMQSLNVNASNHGNRQVGFRVQNKLPSIKINHIIRKQQLIPTNNAINYWSHNTAVNNYRNSQRLFNFKFPTHLHSKNDCHKQKTAQEKYAQNDEKQNQLNQIVKQLKQCILFLKQQACSGQKISQKILNHMDRKIIYKLIENIQGQPEYIRMQSKVFFEQLQEQQKTQKLIGFTKKSIVLSPHKLNKPVNLSHFKDQQANQFDQGVSVQDSIKYKIQTKIGIQNQIIQDESQTQNGNTLKIKR